MICTKCKEDKNKDQFHFRIKQNYLEKVCKSCREIQRKQYREKNKEQKRLYDKKYREKNKDKIKDYWKKWYKENKDKIKDYVNKNKDTISVYNKQYSKKWRIENKQKKKIIDNNYRINNKEKINKYRIEKKKNDIEFRIACNLRNRIYNVIKRNQKQHSLKEYLGCSIEYLKKHLENQFQNGMSWENYGKWHIDHIIPCASYNLSKKEEQKKCFHYTNLQPLWAKDNLSKKDKII